ncbi:hypothetical protein GQ457_15G012800 [Hibiscus cannabinus]
MPKSHNATMDMPRLLLIHAIMNGIKFNGGHVTAKEIYECRKSNEACMVFPYLIIPLYRQKRVPSRETDQYTPIWIAWTRKEYLKRMNIFEATPFNIAMPKAAVEPSTSILAEQPTSAEHQPSLVATPDSKPTAQHEHAQHPDLAL